MDMQSYNVISPEQRLSFNHARLVNRKTYQTPRLTHFPACKLTAGGDAKFHIDGFENGGSPA